MKKRKAKIIKDPKRRGEWVETVFVARAAEYGLPVSKPWGESESYDFVVGRPGRFVGVQVKSTTIENGGGYVCVIRKQGKAVYAGIVRLCCGLCGAGRCLVHHPGEGYSGQGVREFVLEFEAQREREVPGGVASLAGGCGSRRGERDWRRGGCAGRGVPTFSGECVGADGSGCEFCPAAARRQLSASAEGARGRIAFVSCVVHLEKQVPHRAFCAFGMTKD